MGNVERRLGGRESAHIFLTIPTEEMSNKDQQNGSGSRGIIQMAE